MGVVQSNKELPTDRLSTTDDHGRRLMVHPADVKGRYRNRRDIVSAILLVVFLGLPWIRLGGHQALLLDVSNRRFAVFGLAFWGHDAPMVAFLLLAFVLGLLFLTSVWGRIWCGWACPQTVFIESVFRRIERWTQGDGLARRKLATAPWTFTKVRKHTAKWALYALAALVVSHSFLAYFVGTEELSRMIRLSPTENWGTFLFMGFVTAVILLDFGWFREQFCIVMCPYGRLQTLLMDQNSMAVGYDEKRGEPRRGLPADAAGRQGDCVSCVRCVQVCPTGIDIRRGSQQLECIACTACIDACDEVMTRLNKPTGLIAYRNAWRMPGVRSWIYLALLAVVLSGLAFFIHTRRTLDVTVLRAKDVPYSTDATDMVTNHFKLHVTNRTFEGAAFQVTSATPHIEVVRAEAVSPLAPGQQAMFDAFVRFPKALLKNGHAGATLIFTSPTLGTETQEVHLVGPFQ